jgi:hypothetical protein
MQDSFDIFFDLTSELTKEDIVFSVKIPDKFVPYKWRGFCYDLSALFRYNHPSTVNTASWNLTVRDDYTTRDPMIAMLPYGAMRVRVDKPTEVYNISGSRQNIIATSFGEIILNTKDSTLVIAKYRLEDPLYPSTFEIQNENQFDFVIEESNTIGDSIKFNLSTSRYTSSNGKVGWTPVYFIIKFRFFLIN